MALTCRGVFRAFCFGLAHAIFLFYPTYPNPEGNHTP